MDFAMWYYGASVVGGMILIIAILEWAPRLEKVLIGAIMFNALVSAVYLISTL